MGMAPGGWPDDWEERKAGLACPLCATLGTGDDDHSLLVAVLADSEVRLERRSRLAGYCIVVWRHGHVAEPTELTPEAAAGYWRDVVAVAGALEVAFRPVKVNLMTLGNWVPHLHTHVVPRYLDDPAPGGPLPWESMFHDTPLDVAVLAVQAEAIRIALAGAT